MDCLKFESIQKLINKKTITVAKLEKCLMLTRFMAKKIFEMLISSGLVLSKSDKVKVIKQAKKGEAMLLISKALTVGEYSKMLSEEQKSISVNTKTCDPLFEDAVRFVIEKQRASVSSLQNKFSIEKARAAKLIYDMECNDYISDNTVLPRLVFIQKCNFKEYFGKEF